MNMVTRWLPAVFLLTALAVGSAPRDGTQSFTLPGHGVLQLPVPDSWAGQIKQSPEKLPPTIVFGPKSGTPFQFLITAVWPIGDKAALPGLAEVRQEVQSAAQEAAPQSAEGILVLQELSGTSNRGYYFKATDRAPKVGEFKYLTQGVICIGHINLAFTLLTNDGQDSIVRAALEALRRASQSTV